MGINKIVYGGNTLIDLTDSTLASADQLAQGITAYDRTGTKITGTATGGGGAVIQDEDGGLHFLEDGVNAFSDAITTLPNGGLHHVITGVMASGGGLEYEEGTLTPTEDVVTPSISFTNTHSTRPFYVCLMGVYDTTPSANSVYNWMFRSFYDFLGIGMIINSSQTNYARADYYYKTDGNYGSGGNWITSLTGSGSTSMDYYVTSSGFTARGSSSYYYRSGTQYKWIAVWK